MTAQGPAGAFQIDDGARQWQALELQLQVEQFSDLLRQRRVRVLATLMDNCTAWVAADRAAAEMGVVHVPLPPFFTPAQVAHALQAAGVSHVLAPAGAWQGGGEAVGLAGSVLQLSPVAAPPGAPPAALPAGTAKITFTSGTTGTPKGVCLTGPAMQRVAQSLVQATEPLDIRRHLCALPFAVLLENIAGLMAPLRRGAVCIVRPLQELGLTGSSQFDPARFHAAVLQHQPHSTILLPQMLRAWVGYLARSGQRAPASLKLVAVGGAAVGAPLIQAAQALGIPACEGYGLSEGGSVQTLNLPGASRPGSAGRALPHAQLRVAADGEIEITGSLFAGYLGDTAPPPAWWPTGDLGHVDEDGFLHLQGRKKNLLITAFGRNVSPEWIETALRSNDCVAQAVVFGDGEPALSAVLWPLASGLPDERLQQAVDAANAGLPDYARIHTWVRAQADFSPETGLATANGRPQRAAIWQAHARVLAEAGALHTPLPDPVTP
jgi:long-chain acyl-CoA synthetase